jgi:hypothetical protein
MPAHDPEVCKSFVYTNRVLAVRFKAKAREVLAVAQSVEDSGGRLLLADLSRVVEQRAAQYELMATQQEHDLGVRCHCPVNSKD